MERQLQINQWSQIDYISSDVDLLFHKVAVNNVLVVRIYH